MAERPLRVTLCPVNTAGVPWTNAQALRRRGVDARLVVFERYKLHPEADESLDAPSNSLLLSRQAKQWAAAQVPPRTAQMRKLITDATHLAFTRQRLLHEVDVKRAASDERALLAAITADRTALLR